MMIDRNLEIKEELEELEGWVMWECPEDDDDDDDGGLEAKDKKITPYSLRHTGITFRMYSGVSHLTVGSLARSSDAKAEPLSCRRTSRRPECED